MANRFSTSRPRFHVQEEGWDYQHPMREVGKPEDWPSRAETREAYVDRIPEKYREEFLRERPIELREVAPRDMFDPEVESDVNQLWFRMEAAKGQSPQMQHCLLAYASDMNLLGRPCARMG